MRGRWRESDGLKRFIAVDFVVVGGGGGLLL